jgi:hypothetical protein
MDGPARSRASNRTQRVVEIGAGLSSHEISFERTTLTLAYASRLIDEERWARNAAWQVVQAAATFGHGRAREVLVDHPGPFSRGRAPLPLCAQAPFVEIFAPSVSMAVETTV